MLHGTKHPCKYELNCCSTLPSVTCRIFVSGATPMHNPNQGLLRPRENSGDTSIHILISKSHIRYILT